ncbi:MAG: hypothetical protein L6Q92_10890 [Phycisphaerae bacterium]|nr:hypothetical protein [Phycisphaerae bacterium]
MWSLRSFHIFFLLVAIIAADGFGVWALRRYTTTHDPVTFVLGAVTLAGGFALIGYAFWLVRKLDRANIH